MNQCLKQEICTKQNILVNLKKGFVILYFLGIAILFPSCEIKKQTPLIETPPTKVDVKPKNIKYGFDLDQFRVVKKKIRRGDTFGSILEDNGIDYPEVHNILKVLKNKVSVNRLVVGKYYSLFFSKDSTPSPKVFIYEPQIDSYTIVQLRDSIYGKNVSKPVKIITKEGNGLIENSLYETMTNSGLNGQLTYYLADVYAWNIDFYRLHKGDRFKVIYTEKFIDDTVSLGLNA